MSELYTPLEGFEPIPSKSTANDAVLQAALVVVNHISDSIDRDVDAGEISQMIKGLITMINTLPKPFQVHSNPLGAEDHDPKTRNFMIQQRLRIMRESLSGTGVIKILPDEEIFKSLTTEGLLEMLEEYKKQLQPVLQTRKQLEIAQRFRPSLEQALELTQMIAEEKRLLKLCDKVKRRRHDLLDQRLQESFEKQFEEEGVVKEKETPKVDEEKLTVWIARLSTEARGLLEKAYAKQQEPEVEPYRLRDEPYLLLRQANTALREIQKSQGKLSYEQKTRITENVIHLLAINKTKDFLMEASKILEECCATFPRKGYHKQKKWLENIASQLSILKDSMPSEEQIPSSNITRAMVEKSHASLSDLLRSFGMRGPEIGAAVREERFRLKTMQQDFQADLQQERSTRELLDMIIGTQKTGIKKKSKVKRFARKRRNTKAERAKGFTEIQKPKKKAAEDFDA